MILAASCLLIRTTLHLHPASNDRLRRRAAFDLWILRHSERQVAMLVRSVFALALPKPERESEIVQGRFQLRSAIRR